MTQVSNTTLTLTLSIYTLKYTIWLTMFAKVHNLELSATNLDLEISTYSKLLFLNLCLYISKYQSKFHH